MRPALVRYPSNREEAGSSAPLLRNLPPQWPVRSAFQTAASIPGRPYDNPNYTAAETGVSKNLRRAAPSAKLFGRLIDAQGGHAYNEAPSRTRALLHGPVERRTRRTTRTQGRRASPGRGDWVRPCRPEESGESPGSVGGGRTPRLIPHRGEGGRRRGPSRAIQPDVAVRTGRDRRWVEGGDAAAAAAGSPLSARQTATPRRTRL